MTVSPRARGRVPLDQRSVLSTTAGLPWWGALACAVVAILIGFVVDTSRGDVLTMFFTVMYFIGCVLAVLMVRNRSLFSAIAQPPLLLVIAVPLAYRSFSTGPSNGLRSLVFDMGLPLVDRFPTMIVTTLVVWIIGAVRVILYMQERRAAAGKPRKASSTRADSAPRRRAATSAAAEGKRRSTGADTGSRTSRRKKAPAQNGAAPGPTTTPAPSPNGTRRSGRRTAGDVARGAPAPQSGRRRAANHRAPRAAGMPADLAASGAPMRGDPAAAAPGKPDDSASRRRAAGVPPPPRERAQPTPPSGSVRKLPNVRYRGD